MVRGRIHGTRRLLHDVPGTFAEVYAAPGAMPAIPAVTFAGNAGEFVQTDLIAIGFGSLGIGEFTTSLAPQGDNDGLDQRRSHT